MRLAFLSQGQTARVNIATLPLPGGVISGIGLTDLSVLSVPIWEMG